MATLTLKHAPHATVSVFGQIFSVLASLAISFATARAVVKEIDGDNRLTPRGRELLGLSPEA